MAEQERQAVVLRTDIPHIARIYNYCLGGKDNYAADRLEAEKFIAAVPGARFGVRANRAFLGRAVHHLAADAGVRQFLDIGTGLPTATNTHEVAQAAAPNAHILYVDNDPVVCVHAQALLTSARSGRTSYVRADLRDPDTILATARTVFDFDQPIALILVAVLHCVEDRDDPWTIVAKLRDAVPPGSHLVISHPANDGCQDMNRALAAFNNSGVKRITHRTKDQVADFFGDWELLDPGMSTTAEWRAGVNVHKATPMWAAVARKQS